MILVKYVLKNIPLFLLSLSKIPKSILNKIRQKMFSFLWTRRKRKEGVHLVNWESLSRPKKFGGWVFNNLVWFGLVSLYQ